MLALTDLSDLTVYADALNNAGICYSRLGQFDRAVAAQHRAVERHERGARREYEQALGQLGTTYICVGQGPRRPAVPAAGARRWQPRPDSAADAALWAGNLASRHIDLGDWDDAERFNDEAKRLKAAAIRERTGLQHAEQPRDIAAAPRAARRRLAPVRRGAGELGDDPSVRVVCPRGARPRGDRRATRPAEAMRHFEAALETIEKTRSDLMKTDYKLSYLTRLIAFYRAYVDALVDQGQIERALEIADSSRGRVLAERQGVGSAGASPRRRSLRKRAAESGTVFLSYWLAPARSYLWVVTPARVQLFTLPPAQDIEALVRQHQAGSTTSWRIR